MTCSAIFILDMKGNVRDLHLFLEYKLKILR